MSIEELIERANRWAEDDPDEETASELRQIVAARVEDELVERMAGPLEFGTAGLRGIIGAGESRMNRAVIIRTTAGLARYLVDTVPGAAAAGVVVGYDGRRFSEIFARETARVLAGAGVVAHLFPDLGPTPLVAFGVDHLGAAGGVMITASHNPAEYNGYKVYWGNGAQIVPPHDKGIADAIDAVLSAKAVPRPTLDEGRAAGVIRDVGQETVDRYRNAVAGLAGGEGTESTLRIVYTPMHGVGDPFARETLKRFGFTKVWTVPLQKDPDPNFSTVRFPNPEEPGALDLALALAQDKGADLILANDPDADRLAVAVPSDEGEGGFRQLTGNEVGALLGEHLLRTGAFGGGSDRLVMTTVVSSPMLGVMAKHFGVRYAETLTGFKWIATEAMRLEAEEGLRFVFGYEEALGYTIGTVARDKDGISAAAVFAQLAAAAADEGRTVVDELERLARVHGLFVSRQKAVVRKGLGGAAEMRATMDCLRSDPPDSIGGLEVVALRDMLAGTRRTKDGSTESLSLPKANVIAFDLSSGARVVARPSGTEPKIKFYFDLREEVSEAESYADAKGRAIARLAALESAFLDLVG